MIKASVSRIFHRTLNRLGLEIRLLKNLRLAEKRRHEDKELETWGPLAKQSFETVLDIGANEGQFLRLARQLWPNAHIHSFEPLPAVYGRLQQACRDVTRATAYNLALSSSAGNQHMFQSDFSPSSSLLEMTDVHRTEWPQSAGSSNVVVRLETMDAWVESLGEGGLDLPMLIKIDVQGHELDVLMGGEETLRKAAFIVLEVSFEALYEGQALFADIHRKMEDSGFLFRGFVEQFLSKDGSRVLFADAIFENASLAPSEA